MKITAKMTKDTLVSVLRANYKSAEVADKNLAERIVYTVKSGKATRKDLVDLTKEVMTLLGDKFVEPTAEAPKSEKAKKPAEKTVKAKAENSVKKAAKVEKPAEKTEVEAPAEKTEEVKTKKKSAKKSDGVTVLEQKAVQLAEVFPDTIEVDGETYEIAHEVKTIKDLLNGEFEFAFYWTKRHLRQFAYFNGRLGQPTSFKNDLDTAQLIYVSDEGRVAYCVSDATEVPYTILPSDLEEVDGLRFANGCEFQIYRRKADK